MFIYSKKVIPVNFEGLVIRDYTASSDCSSSMASVVVEAGALHKRAFSKRSDKYYFVSSGEIEFCIGDEKTILRTGDVALVQKGAEFSYRIRRGL